MIWGEPLVKEAVSVSSSGSYDLVHSIIWLTSTFLWCSFWVPRSHPPTQPLDTTLSVNFHTSQSPSKILLILQSPVQTSCSLCSETDKHSAVSFKTEWVFSKRKNSRFSFIIIFILIWSPQPYCTFLEHRDHIFLYFWSLTWSLAQENWVNINSESVSGVGCGLPRATEMCRDQGVATITQGIRTVVFGICTATALPPFAPPRSVNMGAAASFCWRGFEMCL